VIPSQQETMKLEPSTTAALRLHEYLTRAHWDGHRLVGPDVGIRFNSRIGRFIKSYLRGIPWNDDYCYLQAQGYWVLGNWQLFSLFGEEKYREIAVRCSGSILAQQREDGAWEYPNPEWRGRIATVEGTWAALGLLESYRQTGDAKLLAGAQEWHEFLVREIGFQQVGEELAANYFSGRQGSRIPNISAFVLPFLAELAEATGQEAYLEPCCGLMQFLQAAQETSGEFPYAVPGEPGSRCWRHFQCFQYNAFQCVDLMRYYDLSGDAAARPLIRKVLSFLRRGCAEDGHSFFECGDRHREVTYHTAVLARAFAKARGMSIDGYDALAKRAYSYLLSVQRPDGGFSFSRRDYFFLSDQRSYPRNLAMILSHLLPETPMRMRRHVQSESPAYSEKTPPQDSWTHSSKWIEPQLQ
jgi:hypothetical protein